jgi:hypothetical protein
MEMVSLAGSFVDFESNRSCIREESFIEKSQVIKPSVLEETCHKPGDCSGAVATKFWTFRWEYYCQPCGEYEWCGSKALGYMTAR